MTNETNETNEQSVKKRLTKKFWGTLVIFSLVGQIAWVVENMYFNVFIYKMFHATAGDIALMVSASAIAATVTTLLIGALSDRVGKRKIFICGGYILWGISILSFALIRVDILTPLVGSSVAAASLGVTLVIIMDCVMTFFGSSANDACFNAWLTDSGDESNRGKIEGLNAMMPMIGILVVFGGFMAFNLDLPNSWTKIFIIIGGGVVLIGIMGIFLIEDRYVVTDRRMSYWDNVLYSFRISVIREHKLLYAVVGAFAVFGISIQIFMPYLILYYEQTLGMENYVMIMAPAIIVAAIITAFYGKVYDAGGFKLAVIPTIICLMLGYVFLYFGRNIAPVFIGSLLMMTGYLTGMAVFGAMIRNNIPQNKAGLFQGLRIFGQVFIPGIIGPTIGKLVLNNATEIINSDGTTSFLPNQNIYFAAFVAAIVLFIVLALIFRMVRTGHYDLDTDQPVDDWSEYPRPQMKRESYYNLNGQWEILDGKGSDIRIPYPPESLLSGYTGRIGNRILYSKQFVLPEGFINERVLLHFGAVDQVATVTVNGKIVIKHEGGYLPFTVDITEELKVDGNQQSNELIVEARDAQSTIYPYGKQRKKRGGMWYTPVSGIWQSVWLESVSNTYITNIKHTYLDNGIMEFMVETKANTMNNMPVAIALDIDDIHVEETYRHGTFQLDLNQLVHGDGTPYQYELWSPENPKLYWMKVQLGKDVVETYFALRTIDIQDVAGRQRICLNHNPIFLHGVLDQGYFSDGLFLPSSPTGYRDDILRMQELGFNMLRKHVKVEPDIFYYYCDILGMLVMQDMVNNGPYRFLADTVWPTFVSKQRRDTKQSIHGKRKKFFVSHSIDTIKQLYNHPCIIGYTVFNEGWGQFQSDVVGDRLRKEDSTRFYDLTSGWFSQKSSDVDSEHIYYKTSNPKYSKKPYLISECGGFTLKTLGHMYSRHASYGYGELPDGEELMVRIEEMYENKVIPEIKNGLCGSIYTQLSDVEDEINGLYTYDRKVCKVVPERMQIIAERLKQ